jgi:hypothetical protein
MEKILLCRDIPVTRSKGVTFMSSSLLPQNGVKKWRVILFSIVAGLLTLLMMFGGVRDILLFSGQSGFPSDIHRWHEAQSGVLTVIVFGGSLLALLWRPLSKVLLMQFLILAFAITCIAFATVSGAGFTPLFLASGGILIAILMAAYPRPRDLMRVSRGRSLSYPLLAITVIAAIFLAPVITRELNYQMLGMTEHDVHAMNYHWLTSVVLALLLLLAGSLAATKQPGWHMLGFIAGTAFLYLGSMALFLADYAGSWGTTDGVLGILGGLGYIATTVIEMRKGRSLVRAEISHVTPEEVAQSAK